LNRGAVAHHPLARAASAAPSRARAKIRRERVNAAELARRALAKDFRNIDPRVTRIILVEAGPRLLPSFPEDLSDDATRRLEQLGVEIRLGAPVTAIDPSGVEIGTARIEARTVIWTAGVGASPAGHWIGAKCDRVGRIEVDPNLAVPGHPEIFAIGAREWLAIGVEGQRSVDLRGLVAWVIWTVAHIYFLIGFRNRTIVALNWLWAYFTFQRGARLGVDSERERLAALSNGTITRSLPLRRAAAVGSN
jgi:NADH dehydrogenase